MSLFLYAVIITFLIYCVFRAKEQPALFVEAVFTFVFILLMGMITHNNSLGQARTEDHLQNKEIYEVISASDKQNDQEGSFYLIIIRRWDSGEALLYRMKEIPPKTFYKVKDQYYAAQDPTNK